MKPVVLSGFLAALVMLLFSVYIFLAAPKKIETQFDQPLVKSLIDPGFVIGPISLLFEPIIEVPETVAQNEAFPIRIDMNLVDASPIGLSEVRRLFPDLGNALQLRLLLGGAKVQPPEWQSVGADLIFEWSVIVEGGSNHIGSIEKRIVLDDIAVGRSQDQMRIEIKVDSAFTAWKEAWGLVTGIVGFLFAIGSFYFSWREHLRKEQAHHS